MAGPITLALEGTTDVAVAKRLLHEVGLAAGSEYIKNGKSALDQSLAGYNSAARFSCWLVLRDLDQDSSCAPDLRRRLLPVPAAHMRLHIPVRAIESWLLADGEAMSRFLSVAPGKVPVDPEALPHPKRALVDLARHSRRKTVREAMVPAPGVSAVVGPGYTASLIEFAVAHWRPAIAAKRSQSLDRLRNFLRSISEPCIPRE